MTITRRDVLQRAGKAVVITAAALTAGVGTTPAKASQPGPLCEGVQALVNEIRRDLDGKIMTSSFWALMEVADRLEALPGIQPIPNENWERYWKPSMAKLPGGRAWATLRPPLAGAI